jgi:DNA-binding transcriptional LysR family regulator
MNTEDASVFVTAVTAGSLSEAARRLGISPMTATRRLTSLEATLGVRLLHRTTRALALTPEGEAFLPFAEALVDNAQQGRARVRSEGRGAAGLLRVSVPIAFGLKLVAPMVPDLLAANPELQVSLDMSDHLPDLVSTGTDLAIRISRLRDSSLIAQKLADNPRSLVASPAYAHRRGLPRTTAELAGHDCLPMNGVSHWTFTRADHEASVRVAGRFSASSIAGCHAACLAGGGIALLSDWNAAEDVEAGRLLRVVLDDAVPEVIGIWAVYPTTRLVLPKVRVFIAALRCILDGPEVGSLD